MVQSSNEPEAMRTAPAVPNTLWENAYLQAN
jgi:hypothetical protein